MPLETATFINQLVASNPAHTDGLNQGDGHLRLIKSVLQAQFPNFTAVALNSTEAQLDAAVNVLTGVSGQAAFPAGTVGAPSISFTGDPDSGFYQVAEDQIGLSINGANVATFSSASLGGQAMPGAIWMYQGSSPPTGWAWLNGQTVTSAANPGLNAIYGNTGGNITLPDWRCYVPVGVDNMGGRGTTGRIAASGVNANIGSMASGVGESAHQLTTGELATHSHSASDSGHGHSDSGHSHGVTVAGTTWFGNAVTGNYANGGVSGQISASTQSGVSINTGFANISTGFANITIGNQGSNTAHNIVQLGLTTGFIIKLG